VPSLPALDAGTRVRLAVGEVDLIERSVACVYRETLGPGPGAAAGEQGER
jgi:hypothetical protein